MTVGVAPGGAAWCSGQVDSEGDHVAGQEIPCPADCPTTDCPRGFRRQLGTCVQEGAGAAWDLPVSPAQAEEVCLEQGARLWQPRSTRALAAAAATLPRLYSAARLGSGPTGIHAWAGSSPAQQTALGLSLPDTSSSASLVYLDGSRVPAGLMAWAAARPTTGQNDTCVTMVQQNKLSNSECDQFSGSGQPALSFVCEARPATTTDQGEVTHAACVFPFKEEAGGSWRHSCVYDDSLGPGKSRAWCPTQLDSDGVVVAGQTGDCDDERNTAYAGPDADNTCKLPFFYEGVWYENCTLSPREGWWCPTEVDPVTREMTDSSNWGYCPDKLISTRIVKHNSN